MRGSTVCVAADKRALTVPDAQLPTPDARLPTPDARLPTPDARLPTPHTSLRAAAQAEADAGDVVLGG
jgi:hypothetical protein